MSNFPAFRDAICLFLYFFEPCLLKRVLRLLAELWSTYLTVIVSRTNEMQVRTCKVVNQTKALPHLVPVPCDTQQQLLRERMRKKPRVMWNFLVRSGFGIYMAYRHCMIAETTVFSKNVVN